ncbi:MAG: hypothetical protein GYA31_02150 [Parcubacteria group bacterium]|nr:hypothetical protein [Parcubacteria group bacterium]
MENFKKKFIILILTSIGIFLIAGLLLFLLMKDINKAVIKAQQSQQEIAHRTAILDRIQTLEREANIAHLYTNSLNQALPTEDQITSLDNTFKNLATSNNINLSFRFGNLNQATEQEPKNYSFNLVLDGHITSILNWLDAVEKLPYNFRLTQIEINQTAANNYNVKILGNVYLR